MENIPTTRAELLDVSNESFRLAIKENVYGPDMEFEVRVLTDPQPASTSALRKLLGTGDGSFGNPDLDDSKPLNYEFVGRIIHFGKSRPSSHIFVPDPCNLSKAPVLARGKTTQFNDCHLVLIVRITNGSRAPVRGDTIKVALRKGDPYQFDLQFAFSDGTTLQTSAPDLLERTIQCQSLSDLDWEAAGDTSSPLVVPDPGLTGVELSPTAKFTQSNIDFLEKLRAIVPTSIPLYATSGYRDARDQASVMAGMITDSGVEEFRYTYGCKWREGIATYCKAFEDAYKANSGEAMVAAVNSARTANPGWALGGGSHGTGRALDLRTKNLTDEQVATLKASLQAAGATNIGLEPHTTKCWNGTKRLDEPGIGKCLNEHFHFMTPSAGSVS